MLGACKIHNDYERDFYVAQRLFNLSPNIATSYVMLSGGVTLKVFLTRSVPQGCPLSPLLFAIVTHPLLAMLSNLAANGDIVGFHIPSGG